MKPATLQILRSMSERLHPLQLLEVTFAVGDPGFRALGIINELEERKQIRFAGSENEKVFVLAVLVSHDWAHNPRKLMMQFLPEVWENLVFRACLLWEGVDSIKVASDSPLHALQSSREKKREEAFAEISKSVFTEDIKNEIRGWGFDYHVEPTEDAGLFMAWIQVRNGNDAFMSIYLDGWSGNILDENKRPIQHCGITFQVTDFLKKNVEKYAEQATT